VKAAVALGHEASNPSWRHRHPWGALLQRDIRLKWLSLLVIIPDLKTCHEELNVLKINSTSPRNVGLGVAAVIDKFIARPMVKKLTVRPSCVARPSENQNECLQPHHAIQPMAILPIEPKCPAHPFTYACDLINEKNYLALHSS